MLSRTFDSKDEMLYAEHLAKLQKEGKISGLEFQVSVTLRDEVLFVPVRVDFRYFDERLGEMVYDEFKGGRSQHWVRIKTLWAKNGPGIYRVTVKRRNGEVPFASIEEIYPVAAPDNQSTGALIAQEYRWKLGGDLSRQLANQINDAIELAVNDVAKAKPKKGTRA